MKRINKIAATVVAGLALATTSCTDYSDYNTVPVDANEMANKTLYQNICDNNKLQDFAAIIKKANYGSTLSASQCFTLWAPIDGTYDANAILAMDSATIVDRFINMHMTQYSHPVSGNVDERVITINSKHHSFTNTTFDDYQIVDANIPATNGLIHTIDGASEYHPNIYEALDEIEGCDEFVNYLKSYDVEYIDTRKSVEGPLVNGQQSYLDTVWAKRNNVIRNILRADIEDEDSSFTVLFPTDKAWNGAIQRISPLYKYISTIDYMDVETNNFTKAAASVTATDAKAANPVKIDGALYTDSLPKSQITRNLAFSNSYPQNKPLLTGTASATDSLFSVRGNRLSNTQEVLGYCGDLRSMSNGYVRTLDSLCFKPWETYETVRSYLAPERIVGLKAAASYTVNTFGQDTLVRKHPEFFTELPDFIKYMMFPEGQAHFQYISTDSINMSGATAKPELDFALRNVLSTKYKIYVVMVPSQLNEPERPLSTDKTEVKNLYLRFDMAYTDADNKQQFKRLNVPGAKTTADIVIQNDAKFHVVELEFEFPICYSGLEAYPTLFMSNTKSFTSSSNRNKFEQELRVARIFLVPEGANDYVQSLKF